MFVEFVANKISLFKHEDQLDSQKKKILSDKKQINQVDEIVSIK